MDQGVKDLQDLIKWHRDVGREERRAIDRCFLSFDGKLSQAFDDIMPGPWLTEENILAAPNLISTMVRAIATALSYGNPSIYVRPEDPETSKFQGILTGGLKKLLREIYFPQLLRSAVIKALVGKRAAWKVGWDVGRDLPTAAVVDPRSLFFDRDAAIWRDVTYYIQLVEMPEARFKRKVKEGIYRNVSRVEPKKADADLTIHPEVLKSSRKVVYVWEHYDLEAGTVCHLPDGADAYCFEDDLAYNPFVGFSLDINGVDCLGSSEADRALRQQQNLILAYYILTKVMAKSVPGMILDASAFDEDDVNRLNNDAEDLGGNTVVERKSADQTRSIQDSVIPKPMPTIPPIFGQIIGAAQEDATNDASYSEIRAGKPGGFRSATEAAIADANVKSKIADKEANLGEGLGRLGDLLLYVTGRYRRDPLFIPGADLGIAPDQWQQLSQEILRKGRYYCEIGLFNAARKNPDVYAETLMQNFQTFAGLPFVKAPVLTRALFAAVGLPMDAVQSDAELGQAAQAAQQAQAAQAPQAAAAAQTGPAPGPEAGPSPMAPEAPTGPAVMPPGPVPQPAA